MIYYATKLNRANKRLIRVRRVIAHVLRVRQTASRIREYKTIRIYASKMNVASYEKVLERKINKNKDTNGLFAKKITRSVIFLHMLDSVAYV